MVASLLAVETLWQRELIRFWRQKSRVLGVVASPLIFWAVIGFGSGPNGPKLFFPGTVVLTVLFSAIFSTMSIIEDRREGFLLSMLVSPASRTSLVLGKILGSATLAWIQGMVILAFAPLAGIDLSLGELAPLSGIVFLISFTLTALGFLIAWKFDSTQGYHAVMNLLLLPMWLLSGAVFSISGASAWIRAIMLVNPLTYSTALLRQVLTPGISDGSPQAATSLAVTAIFGIVLPAALPEIMVGIRTGLVLALITMVTSEMIARKHGVGDILFNALAMAQYETVYATIIIIGALGFIIDVGFEQLRAHMVAWAEPTHEIAVGST